jgi:hypothetical protein
MSRQSPRANGALALIAPVVLSILLLTPASAPAQDLFELEVFTADTTRPGGYEVAFHTNGMSRGAVAADVAVSNHRPVHLSVEVARGWTDRFETGVLIQTAPFGAARSSRFAGGHVRAKFKVGDVPRLPLGLAIGGEYTFNRHAFDRELQTFEVRSILDYRAGRLLLLANPSFEIVTRGSDGGLEPTFDLSAKAGWRLASRVSVGAEYFSRPATTRHLVPEQNAHHLVFAGLDVELAPRWELGFGAGHCVTRSEPWVMKSVIGYRF